ncbi:small multidrug resistance protein [Fibrisoma limi BUZ 3]|uniref:Guanidinium exporter n=1 Tax=Fibrisoma limi BUZ 3 TaxID=1185876 RepID=I2GDI1_9BACT|nr:SMR family transporter [Fibrisoma limi]CCH51955.1 small multidrug resistance protein [Fibrisoma limi BUZ 3]
MQAWFFLLIAATFETAWTYSVKYMKFTDLKLLRWHNFYSPQIGLPILAPIVGYVVFGIANIYFFSMAIKQIPTPTAFAVWTAMALILIKLVDVFIFHANWSVTELFFLMLIGIGIVGLRLYAAA